MDIPKGDLYEWNQESTYVQEPPYFIDLAPTPAALADIHGARVLALLGDSVTTDHISPAGSIAKTSPAAQYLINNDVAPVEFNSYGSRRGNHEVMIRGTFANIRLRNQLVPGSEGNITRYFPTGEDMSIYDASMYYQQNKTPLIVIGGKEYGSGSSRDWAAKGTLLLGVQMVLVESFERIHRSNLVGMGVLPAVFLPGENAASLGLTGDEIYRHHRHWRWPEAEQPNPDRGHHNRTDRLSNSKRSPASTAPSSSTTTAMAASCKRCFAGSPRPKPSERTSPLSILPGAIGKDRSVSAGPKLKRLCSVSRRRRYGATRYRGHRRQPAPGVV